MSLVMHRGGAPETETAIAIGVAIGVVNGVLCSTRSYLILVVVKEVIFSNGRLLMRDSWLELVSSIACGSKSSTAVHGE
jgi:hypothetical protein